MPGKIRKPVREVILEAECLTYSVSSPIGSLTLVEANQKIVQLLLESQLQKITKSKGKPSALLLEAEKQLKDYFLKKRRSFNLPLAPEGTVFQKLVWDVLTKVPFGERITYGDLSLKLGSRDKARAVGTALGRNPLPIFIPCHRVVAARGQLGGFSLGLEIKKFLLSFETEQL